MPVCEKPMQVRNASNDTQSIALENYKVGRVMGATFLPRYHDFDFGMISSLFLKLHTSNSLSVLSTLIQLGTFSSRIAFSYCSYDSPLLPITSVLTHSFSACQSPKLPKEPLDLTCSPLLIRILHCCQSCLSNHSYPPVKHLLLLIAHHKKFQLLKKQ